MQAKRPKHLDLIRIRLPIPGMVSIFHRVSGALMFFAIPFALAALQGTLSEAECFARFQAILHWPLVKLALIALLWAYLHHACAGVRFLLIDLDIGVNLRSARASAWAVFAVSLSITAGVVAYLAVRGGLW